jgi:hypothetical protein
VLNWILRVLGFNTSILEEILSTLSDLKTQIADLISKLPADGGLTAAEVADLKSDLEALQTKAGDAADDYTPVTPIP